MKKTEDRLIDIEIKLAYHEKVIKDLNDVICEQQNEIEKLGTICKRLVQQGEAYEQFVSGIDGAANERPPHY